MMDEVMPSEALNKEYVRSVTVNKGVQVKKQKIKNKGVQVRTSLTRFLKLKKSGRSP